MGISPQIRYAVERALERATQNRDHQRKIMESIGVVTLQAMAWGDECESLTEAVEILKGLE